MDRDFHRKRPKRPVSFPNTRDMNKRFREEEGRLGRNEIDG